MIHPTFSTLTVIKTEVYNQIKGLNGLRAIAAIVLLLLHSTRNEFATWICVGMGG